MDLISVYDCYTITGVTIEDAGFCPRGEGQPFVREHDLFPSEADFPCNTHGGQLGFGQAGLAGGCRTSLRAPEQVHAGGAWAKTTRGPTPMSAW